MEKIRGTESEIKTELTRGSQREEIVMSQRD